MDENMNFINDEEIFSKVKELMERLEKNQELQDLAERNGLDVKNSVRLNSDTQNNVAISIVALLLARKANDPKYRTLTHTGLQKRRLKADIINTYKGQANQIIQKYRDSKVI